MENESDSILIAKAKEDSDAFGALYERYVSRIYRYIYYRTGNPEDAQDLTSKTFFRALRKMPQYVDRGVPFTAWLYRIAHNVVANWLRDQSRKPVVALDAVVVTSGKAEDPDYLAEVSEERDRVLVAVRKLQPDRQELLTLKFLGELSNAEIGTVMGRSEGAVKSLYHRTLVALREDLVREAAGTQEGSDGKKKRRRGN